jgi:hypothetical protein
MTERLTSNPVRTSDDSRGPGSGIAFAIERATETFAFALLARGFAIAQSSPVDLTHRAAKAVARLGREQDASHVTRPQLIFARAHTGTTRLVPEPAFEPPPARWIDTRRPGPVISIGGDAVRRCSVLGVTSAGLRVAPGRFRRTALESEHAVTPCLSGTTLLFSGIPRVAGIIRASWSACFVSSHVGPSVAAKRRSLAAGSDECR